MKLLKSMYMDGYYPKFLVDKIRVYLEELIEFLETKEKKLELIQEKLDETINKINELEEEFYKNGSEIETMAREDISESVYLILKKYNIDIDLEEATRMRKW